MILIRIITSIISIILSSQGVVGHLKDELSDKIFYFATPLLHTNIIYYKNCQFLHGINNIYISIYSVYWYK